MSPTDICVSQPWEQTWVTFLHGHYGTSTCFKTHHSTVQDVYRDSKEGYVLTSFIV
jgi:hypothetical protein